MYKALILILSFICVSLSSSIVEQPTLPFTVTGLVRNEFSYDLTLKSATLTQGSWVTAPPTTIASGNQYQPVFSASGSNGVEGVATYVVANPPIPSKPPTATFYFKNVEGNQTYTTVACCSPFIGGVGTKSGDANTVQFQYWTHQMCFGVGCEKKL